MDIPPYTYDNNPLANNLNQGDILKVSGKFRDLFLEFYPSVNHRDEDQDKYVMVVSQTCDLVKNERRKPKVDHITVCLVRKFSDYLSIYLENNLNPVSLPSGSRILDKESYAEFESKIYKLLNNSENKAHFYLPKNTPFTEDMVAILTLPYPFRAEHYSLLQQNKILTLKAEFQAKIGDMLANLYGRVATPDLSENELTDIEIKQYIESIMINNLGLKQVPDKACVDFVKKESNQNNNCEDLITLYHAKSRQKNFNPERMALMKKLREKLFGIFSDSNLCNNLVNMDKQNLRKEISHILTGN